MQTLKLSDKYFKAISIKMLHQANEYYWNKYKYRKYQQINRFYEGELEGNYRIEKKNSVAKIKNSIDGL